MIYRNFSNLVIAGGATKVISAIGVMRFLEENNMMDSIKNVVGTSAGAIVCAFIALGYKSNEIKDFFLENMCGNDKISQMNMDDIFGFFNAYGLSKGDNLFSFFQKMISYKLGENRKSVSFIELAKLRGKNLVICVSNLTTEKQEFWNVDTTPNTPIETALRASCAIPIMFTPVVLNDMMYLDGGLFDNFPIDYFHDVANKTTQFKIRDILGINIKSKGYQKNSNVLEFVKFIISSVMNKLTHALITDSMADNIISLEFEDDDWISLLEMSIKIDNQKVNEYIEIGYDAIKEKMSKMYIDFM